MSPHSITQIMPFECAEALVEETSMQRILAIDDDPAVTSLLKRGLAYEGYAVDVAGSGEAGLALAREHHPDLAILDIMMPGMSGLEVLRRLHAADPQLPVIMLTARDAPADQVQGLEAGADDYVVKPFTFEVLLARVRAQLRRQQTDHPPQLRFADLTLDTASHIVQRGQREITLTSLEFRLLQAFLEHPQQVLSKDVLLDRVWGYDFGGNANVVEVYVKQLRQKLEAASEARLLHTLRGAGYVLREE
jgi:DNA-binding response OmpR family regulator